MKTTQNKLINSIKLILDEKKQYKQFFDVASWIFCLGIKLQSEKVEY